jgi:hypothetical protein
MLNGGIEPPTLDLTWNRGSRIRSTSYPTRSIERNQVLGACQSSVGIHIRLPNSRTTFLARRPFTAGVCLLACHIGRTQLIAIHSEALPPLPSLLHPRCPPSFSPGLPQALRPGARLPPRNQSAQPPRFVSPQPQRLAISSPTPTQFVKAQIDTATLEAMCLAPCRMHGGPACVAPKAGTARDAAHDRYAHSPSSLQAVCMWLKLLHILC